MTSTETKNQDIIQKNFWENPEHFADVFNTILFKGETVLIPEELQELDSNVSRIIELPELNKGLVRIRDVVKRAPTGQTFMILGLENQTYVNYAMPLRTLIYDAMGYLKECETIAQKRKGEQGLTSSEFLSKMRKEDRLSPIVTLVIYSNDEPWDGPLTLMDMLEDVTPDITPYITQHRINLLQVRKSSEYHFSNPDVEKVFSISRELFEGNIKKVREQYNDESSTTEVIRMIGSITGTTTFMDSKEGGTITMCKAMDAYIAEKETTAKIEMAQQIIDMTGMDADATAFVEQIKDEKDMMCTAMREYVAEKEKTAKIEGIINTMLSINSTQEQIIKQITTQMSISESDALTYITY
ncbi:MAG: hypothetical protein R3Y40_04755 [Eubacteriales bacterium]